MAEETQAVVPVDKDTDKALADLVSLFSRMRITLHHKDTTDSSEDEEENPQEKFKSSFVTFHKNIPHILATLAKGETITILDNRIRNYNAFVNDGEQSLAPVLYKQDPLSALCDENTMISYDTVNKVIKLWDLRKSYFTYNRDPALKSVIYLSKNSSNSHTIKTNFVWPESSFSQSQDNNIQSLLVADGNSCKYSLNYVLTWPDSKPSVVTTYPEHKMSRKSSVVIEELPDDFIEEPPCKGEVLSLIYKSNLKRKHQNTFEYAELSKRSISNCVMCDKPTFNSLFCEICNLPSGPKRKSTNAEDISPPEAKKRVPNSFHQDYKRVVELKGKRKNPEEVILVPGKRPHLESVTEACVDGLKENSILSVGAEQGPRAAINGQLAEGKLNCSKTVKLSEYLLDNVLLNSVSALENLDWKSKFRKENCEPLPVKIPNLLV